MSLKHETKMLLSRAQTEIQNLRAANAVMAGKLDVFDKMVAIHQNRPSSGGGCMMGPDLLWEIDRHIETESIPEVKPDSTATLSNSELTEMSRKKIG